MYIYISFLRYTGDVQLIVLPRTVSKDRRTDRAAGLSRGEVGPCGLMVGTPRTWMTVVVAINWCSICGFRAIPWKKMPRFLGPLIRMDGLSMKFPSLFLGPWSDLWHVGNATVAPAFHSSFGTWVLIGPHYLIWSYVYSIIWVYLYSMLLLCIYIYGSVFCFKTYLLLLLFCQIAVDRFFSISWIITNHFWLLNQLY